MLELFVGTGLVSLMFAAAAIALSRRDDDPGPWRTV